MQESRTRGDAQGDDSPPLLSAGRLRHRSDCPGRAAERRRLSLRRFCRSACCRQSKSETLTLPGSARAETAALCAEGQKHHLSVYGGRAFADRPAGPEAETGAVQRTGHPGRVHQGRRSHFKGTPRLLGSPHTFTPQGKSGIPISADFAASRQDRRRHRL